MPRKIEFDPDEALEKAIEVFWEQGFQATRMDDLTKAMSINRFSVYNSFGDKRTLFLLALKQYRTGLMDLLDSVMEKHACGLTGLLTFLTDLKHYALSDEGKRGCLMLNTAIEVAATDDEVAAEVNAHLKQVEEAFYQMLQMAYKNGQLKHAQNLQERACFLVSIVQGVLAMARGGGHDHLISTTIDMLKKDIPNW